MWKILRRFLIILGVVMVVATIVNPGWWHAKVVPPWPTEYDCTAIEAEIKKYDWDTETATAVMKAESSCKSDNVGDTDLIYEINGKKYGYSVGAFQIRILEGRELCDSFDIEMNVRCAYEIYSRSGWTAWSMYSNGRYEKFLWHKLF
ncbi:hypothetical protein IJG76_01090 [Candidatus Saccharibacteria bacterium]|nr:hypothetical protein [Candidatus Saccharibacteria bacterium]